MSLQTFVLFKIQGKSWKALEGTFMNRHPLLRHTALSKQCGQKSWVGTWVLSIIHLRPIMADYSSSGYKVQHKNWHEGIYVSSTYIYIYIYIYMLSTYFKVLQIT
jgi:hypothetical protein